MLARNCYVARKLDRGVMIIYYRLLGKTRFFNYTSKFVFSQIFTIVFITSSKFKPSQHNLTELYPKCIVNDTNYILTSQKQINAANINWRHSANHLNIWLDFLTILYIDLLISIFIKKHNNLYNSI